MLGMVLLWFGDFSGEEALYLDGIGVGGSVEVLVWR